MDADLVAFGDDAALLVGIEQRGHRRARRSSPSRRAAPGFRGCAARPARLPYWPCDSRPIDSPPRAARWSRGRSRTRARPRSARRPASSRGRSGRPARTRLTMPRQRASGHCQAQLVSLISCVDPLRDERADESPIPSPRTARIRPARHADAFQALRVELLPHLGIGERLHHLGVDARDDLGRRAGGQPQRRTS